MPDSRRPRDLEELDDREPGDGLELDGLVESLLGPEYDGLVESLLGPEYDDEDDEL